MITPDVIEQIKALSVVGYSQVAIAERLDVGRRTVQRVLSEGKKNALDRASDADKGQVDKVNIHVDNYTKRVQKVNRQAVRTVSVEMAMFEDAAEGWIWHVSLQELAERSGALWWLVIVYPESAPEDWRERLRNLCDMRALEVAISPLHDKDKWEHDSPYQELEDGTVFEVGEKYHKGDFKKAHWHVIVKYPRAVNHKVVAAQLMPLLKCPYPQRCNSLRRAYEYFVHLNHPDRYQYDADEIERLGGFKIEPTARERSQMLAEVCDKIRTIPISNMAMLDAYYAGQVEYIATIARFSHYVKSVVDGVWQLGDKEFLVRSWQRAQDDFLSDFKQQSANKKRLVKRRCSLVHGKWR